MDTSAGSAAPPCYRSPFAARPSPRRAKAGGMRLEPVPFSMLVIGVAFACHSPSPSSLRERARHSAVVIEGRVQSAPHNASGAEPYRVDVKVLDVWPRHSGGLEREQLVTVRELGPTSGPCARVLNDHRYIFFMDPTDEPLVFRASYAPLEASGKDLKKDVGKILCEDCGAPTIKPLRSPVVVTEGARITVKCEASGKPPLSYKWYKDGTILKKSKQVRIKDRKKNSKVQISSARLQDSGNYMCVVENDSGSSNSTSTVHVQSITTALPPGSGHERRCNETEKGYCVNNGECYFIHGINQLSCKCPSGYFGPRCLQPEPLRLRMPKPTEKAEELYQKRVLTITGICVALLVVGIVCVVAYCKTKKQRKKMHNHLRQNMCLDHPNRSLANGPNHPGPGPEEIPMVDYISKNVPATERVMRSGAEESFAGSHHSSRSQNSSTRAHSSTNRHDEKTWSLERTDSVLSDCPSGMLSSSVGTSKCSSPACMEARARRAGHCSFPESRRPPVRYGDSFDSLDSPHSDRYVSALTTPARLSPVDFHYSLPPQVPTFQITSPNANHAMSLPPAARSPCPPEEDQPLLRCYQLPLHEAQRHETYKQRIQQQRARSYLQDSAGSLPSSLYRLAQDDDEYESTQEYPLSLEQPKKSSGRWHRSRLNGHVAPQGYRPTRDLGSRSCLSGSESEEGEEGESTPFLSMQNINTPEPSAIYRPVPPTHVRTSRTQSRHTQQQQQQQQQHARSKPDSAAH
ncbi:neuregulin 2a isoform X4 [Silurus meridionalis]|uniref:neuregulin 2a isoform X4 n=1 Tax=Silurus meridionalis TaxID=175797 RepID=UPI001EEC3D89|nr:neuregulin 2a isoform X4 [Silurus meridionalis]